MSDERIGVMGAGVMGSGIAQVTKIVLATLRKKMLALAVEIADGAVWANGARSHMAESLSSVGAQPDGFFVGNMIPTTIDDDRSAAAAVNRKTLTGYVALPNYRNYWKEAGYVEEMDAIETALAAKDFGAVPGLMSDRWLSDVTLFGSASEVRDGVDAWVDAGVTTPILVPSSGIGAFSPTADRISDTYARVSASGLPTVTPMRRCAGSWLTPSPRWNRSTPPISAT